MDMEKFLEGLPAGAKVELVIRLPIQKQSRDQRGLRRNAATPSRDERGPALENGEGHALMHQVYDRMRRRLDPTLRLAPKAAYVGMQTEDGTPINFAIFHPRARRLTLHLNIPRTDEIDELIEKAGLTTLQYDTRMSQYHLSLGPNDLAARGETLDQLLEIAYRRRRTN